MDDSAWILNTEPVLANGVVAEGEDVEYNKGEDHRNYVENRLKEQRKLQIRFYNMLTHTCIHMYSSLKVEKVLVSSF